MSEQAVLKLEKLKKSYDGKRFVLDGIDLELFPGDMAIIEGKSGSGKSTLMNIIGLLDGFDDGNLFLCGEDASSLTVKQQAGLRAEKIGFVFQAYHLIEAITVRENILLPFLYRGAEDETQLRNRFDLITEELGLKELLNRKAGLLSGGEKQRTAIARAVIKDPVMILADEPTGNLDPENTEIVIRAFRRLRDEGKLIITVTHDISIANAEDRCFYLKEGRLTQCME